MLFFPRLVSVIFPPSLLLTLTTRHTTTTSTTATSNPTATTPTTAPIITAGVLPSPSLSSVGGSLLSVVGSSKESE